MNAEHEEPDEDTPGSVLEAQSEPQGIVLQSREISLSKRCIRKGQGVTMPLAGSLCSVKINKGPTNLNNEWFENSAAQIRIGESDTDEGDVIDRCVQSMTEGEISSFVYQPVNHQDCCGEKDDKTDSSSTELKVELVKIDEAGMPVWQLSPPDKLSMALSLKERGNILYRSGHISLAFNRYSKAIKLLISMLPESVIPEANLSEFAQARCHCYLNLAACQMKSKKWDFVIQNCTKALSLQPDNVKALYRRGQAYQGTEDYNSAKSDLRKCLTLEPKNRSALIALREIAVKIKEKSNNFLDGV